VGSAGEDDALAEEVEAGSSEHLWFQHFEAVDVPFDGSGTVRQGQAVADGVEVAAEVAGEGGKRGEAVRLDSADCNQKGGVGKTTIAACVGQAIALDLPATTGASKRPALPGLRTLWSTTTPRAT
jgi:hypothetical protein